MGGVKEQMHTLSGYTHILPALLAHISHMHAHIHPYFAHIDITSFLDTQTDAHQGSDKENSKGR